MSSQRIDQEQDALDSIICLHWTGGSLDGVPLPLFLESLTFDDNFNHSMDAVFPPERLKTLQFGKPSSGSYVFLGHPQRINDLQLSQNNKKTNFGLKFKSELKIAYGR